VNVQALLAELAALGAGSGGIDRALFSAPEHAARERIATWGRAAGFTIEQDRAANLFVRSGDAAPPVQCGSHLDTVKHGGAYDGAYGVAAGLVALERIALSGARPARPLEVVAWAGEEGSRFPVGTLGSSIYAGLTPLAALDALIADDGASFNGALVGPTGLLPDVPIRDGFPPPAAYVEIHVEQGPVLERAGARLGVVSAISGQRRFAVTLEGIAGHAGTLPMAGRSDALCAASDIVLGVEGAALEIGETVATVGQLTVTPNQTNVVPGRVTLRVDARSVDDARIDALEERLRRTARRIEGARHVRIAIELLESRPATPMDDRLCDVVRSVCLRLDPKALDVVSGAGHDAMCIARVAPAAMIFVPSVAGRSHVGDERTAPEDLELGVDALEGTLRALAEE
jgi:hydantoinase/carbamoylase family amidase